MCVSTRRPDQAAGQAENLDAPVVDPSTPVLGDVKVAASGPAYWRAVWSARHTGTLVVAAVALFAALVSARMNGIGGALGPLDLAAVGFAALAGGVTLATYIPPAGVPAREHLTGGSCGIIPFAAVLIAPFLLAQAPATGVALIALVFCYGMAAGKRITDHASC